MSILLNALKKSEAQRQVGSPPDIHSPAEVPSARRAAGSRWIFGVLVVLAAVAAGWYAWTHYDRPEDSTTPAPLASAESGEVTSAPAETPAVSAEMEAASEMVGAGQKPAVAASLPSNNQQLETEQRKKQLSQSFTQFEAEPQVETREASLPEPEAGIDGEADPMAEVESSMASIAESRTPDGETQSRRRLSRSETGTDSTDQPTESEPISFWQIPQSLRDNMPEFRITVLVYAENPQDRFVLINGVRLREKEELVDGVTLDEIRRDGAVFRYRNYRFLVKG